MTNYGIVQTSIGTGKWFIVETADDSLAVAVLARWVAGNPAAESALAELTKDGNA
jgi:hypothetical protein